MLVIYLTGKKPYFLDPFPNWYRIFFRYKQEHLCIFCILIVTEACEFLKVKYFNKYYGFFTVNHSFLCEIYSSIITVNRFKHTNNVSKEPLCTVFKSCIFVLMQISLALRRISKK